MGSLWSELGSGIRYGPMRERERERGDGQVIVM